MSNYSKYNVIYRLQKWMDSVPGQTFLNYGYSWGASIVILGALFKLTHLPGANFWLFFGMGTEVVVFFLSAFDRPFDKTDDGRELPTRVTFSGEQSFADDEAGDYADESGDDTDESGNYEHSDEADEANVAGGAQPRLVYGRSGHHRTAARSTAPSAGPAVHHGAQQTAADEAFDAVHAAAGAQPVAATMPTTEQVAMAMLNYQRGDVEGAQQQAPEMVEAQTKYVDALKSLTDMLGKVNEQSQRLARDSEEMENLNRTLTGIAKIYEMQLKGASQQVGTIDQINDQTRKMAQQIADLNAIYARMIEAMTVNMRAAAPGAAAPTAPAAE